MRKYNTTRLLFLLGIVSFLTSCNVKENSGNSLEGMDFGESVYYDSFLWVDSNTVTLTKELKFEFSEYAVDKNAYLKLQFDDAHNNKISNKQISIYDDGNLKPDGIITVFAEKGTVTKKIGIQFLPGKDSGKQNGYLTVVSHDFDRIDNIDSDNLGSDKRIKRWSAYYEKDYNPLALGLFWFMIIIMGSLVLWFLVLRNMIHPKFKRGKIQILAPYFGGINMDRNTKLVVFTNTYQKQNGFNKIFTGKIKYEINSIYEKEIILRPGRGNKVKIKLPMGARLTPPVINLEKFNKYKIKVNKEIIEIQYS
jgi:hypothetical protein